VASSPFVSPSSRAAAHKATIVLAGPASLSAARRTASSSAACSSAPLSALVVPVGASIRSGSAPSTCLAFLSPAGPPWVAAETALARRSSGQTPARESASPGSAGSSDGCSVICGSCP
jgi:hypothetical protein